MNFLFKHKLLISILGSSLIFGLGFFAMDYPKLMMVAHILFSLIFFVIMFKTISFAEIKTEIEKGNAREILKEKEKVLKGYNSYINQLSNIIAGLNHEVAPWLGGIQNKIARLKEKAERSSNPNRKRVSGEHTPPMNHEYILKKLGDIEVAADTAVKILKTRSRDVKKLQRYSTAKSNLFDTVATWVGIAMVDQSIKCDISIDNISLHFESLNFETDHSPLLLSQVILNLVKNSVEHNTHMLEDILITINGDSIRNCIIYEDNGKGIPDADINDIFEPGITSKNFEKEIHGLGLSLCVDYCECMGAAITAERSKTGAKFVIYFDYDFDKNPHKISNFEKSATRTGV